MCYNVALKALTREGRWKEARALLTDVAAGASAEGEDERNSAGASVPAGSGVGPRDEPDVLDYLSYNSVIRACALAGEAKEVGVLSRLTTFRCALRWLEESVLGPHHAASAR